jgi:hypothetical protein
VVGLVLLVAQTLQGLAVVLGSVGLGLNSAVEPGEVWADEVDFDVVVEPVVLDVEADSDVAAEPAVEAVHGCRLLELVERGPLLFAYLREPLSAEGLGFEALGHFAEEQVLEEPDSAFVVVGGSDLRWVEGAWKASTVLVQLEAVQAHL